MRGASLFRALLISVLVAVVSMVAKPIKPSLGNVVRPATVSDGGGGIGQEEPTEKDEAFAKQSLKQVEKLSDKEKNAFEGVVSVLFPEMMCKNITGNYVSFDYLVSKPCKGTKDGREMSTGPIKFDHDPRQNPDYTFRLTARGTSLNLAFVPRRSGLAGFFSDGENVYFNPNGGASKRDKLLGKITAIVDVYMASKLSSN